MSEAGQDSAASLARHAPKVRAKPVAELVINEIIEMIASHELSPGMTLPTERELAQQLGVSVVALREATRVLKILGVLRSAPRRGTIVVPDLEYANFGQLGILLGLSAQTTSNVVEARSIVEGQAVRLAALRATADEITQMRRILWRQQESLTDFVHFPQEDEAFHRATVVAAHNPILVTVLDAMSQPLRVVRHQTAFLPGRLQKAVDYHKRLVEAIADHDANSAEKALLDHLEDVAADVKTKLDGGADIDVL